MTASNLPSEFGEGNNFVWKTNLPGRAWSSPVFVDDQVWLTTAVEHKATPEELEEMKRDNTNREGLSSFSKVDLKALRLDRETGKLVAEVDLFTVTNPPVIHSLNSFASPTPVVDDKHVYMHKRMHAHRYWFSIICIFDPSGTSPNWEFTVSANINESLCLCVAVCRMWTVVAVCRHV